MFESTELFKVFFTIKKVLYRDTKTSYTTAEARAYKEGENKRKLTTVKIKGYFPLVYEGDSFSAYVNAEVHPIKGNSLAIQGFPFLEQPQLEKEIITFIAKRVRGVSKKNAEEIVSILGLDVLKRIGENYECLMLIPDMKEKKAKRIHEVIKEQQVFDDLLIFLQQYNIEPSLANKIYNKFGASCVQELKHNPYILSYIPGVTFKQSDRLAFRLGWPQNKDSRIRAAILAFLENKASSKGDMCSKADTLYQDVNDFLNGYTGYDVHKVIPVDEFELVLDFILKKGLVVIEEVKHKHKDETIKYIYSHYYHRIEENIVTKLTQMLSGKVEWLVDKESIEDAILLEEEKSFRFDPKQKEATYSSLCHKFSILTGGPGTGKTQTINTIIKVVEKLLPEATISLLAPTGKAAKRMTELSGKKAYTIHKALGIKVDENEENLFSISSDFVIIDEGSMIDCIMFSSLLDAISDNTRVILVGDFDQLPSVGAGLILRDLINSECIPTTKLTTIFRQAQESQIVMNSHAIIKGKFENLTFDNNKGDFFFLEKSDVYQAKQLLLRSVLKMHKTYGYSVNDICLLAPMWKGELGIDSLNVALQELLNPPTPYKRELYLRNNIFREGDKVMNLENNKDKDIVNGEVGYVFKVQEIEGEYSLEVDFPDRGIVHYTRDECEKLTLCYCMSIHKSQGSEFPVVIAPIHSAHEGMLNKNLIYTALTRAKKRAVLVGELNTLRYAISVKAEISRLSQVQNKLQKRLLPDI